MKGITAATLAPNGFLDPGTPAWAGKASASKVAAMLGLSPFESPFSLWHKMAGNIPWDVDNDTLRRGRYLEPALRQWWRDQHAAHVVERTGTWVSLDRPWQVASPDGIVCRRNIARTPDAILECKTANNDWEWGAEESDEVPPYYRVQAVWTMDVLGLPRTHFAVLTSFMSFRQFTVEYDQAEAEALRGQVAAFMGTLNAGTPPPLDGHDQTYQAVRALHPDIDNTDAEIPTPIAAEFVDAVAAYEAATAAKRAATVKVADLMGTARRAVADRVVLATRQTRSGGTPHLVTARGLTTRHTTGRTTP